VANLVALALSVALCFALIPLWEARGAAVATTVAEIGLAAANLVLLTRFGKGVRLSAAILGPVAVAGALGAAAILLPVPDAGRAVVGAGVFVGALAAMRSIPQELLEALPSRRQSPA
jgi:hypothetical protein